MGKLTVTSHRTFRWAFWGAGAVAEQVALDLALVKGAQLRAVGARNLARARAFAQRHGVPRSVDSLTALLDDPQVDVVYVATPNHCHLEDGKRCIAAGKALLLEKPFALNLAEGRELVDAARAAQVFVMEAMWMRFIPAIQEARRRVQQGALGDIHALSADFGYPAPGNRGRLFDPALGGGALLDRGVYPISLATLLLGRPLQVLGSARLGPTGVDEHCSCLVRFEGGAIANLSASLCGLTSNQATLMGTAGRLTLRAPFYKSRLIEWHAYSSIDAPDVLTAAQPSATALRLRHRLQRVKHWLDPVRNAIQGLRGTTYPFPGFGYQFQLLEVQRCLTAGRCESETMPLSASLETLSILDQIRAQWSQPGRLTSRP